MVLKCFGVYIVTATLRSKVPDCVHTAGRSWDFSRVFLLARHWTRREISSQLYHTFYLQE